jgi:hypothetical protein
LLHDVGSASASDHVLKAGGGSSFKVLLAVNVAKGVP